MHRASSAKCERSHLPLSRAGFGISFAKARCIAMEGIRNKNILIVDDDERMLRALTKTLSAEGAVITHTQSAGDAIEILSRRGESMDLVISDLRMPLVNGAALLGFIRMVCPNLPVIMLTAFGSLETRIECLRQGAAAFLEKNLSTAQLLAEVEQVLATWKRDGRQPARKASGRPQVGIETKE